MTSVPDRPKRIPRGRHRLSEEGLKFTSRRMSLSLNRRVWIVLTVWPFRNLSIHKPGHKNHEGSSSRTCAWTLWIQGFAYLECRHWVSCRGSSLCVTQSSDPNLDFYSVIIIVEGGGNGKILDSETDRGWARRVE